MTGPLRIFAAGSLRPAFDRLADAAPGSLRITYANARDLAQRIAAGERADVFASASEQHPYGLHEVGLVGPPRTFAANRLVVAVVQASPADDTQVIAKAGTRLVIEVAGIPLGDYTRTLLARLEALFGAGFADRALANVVAEEQVVDDVAARLLAGEADAGVLYATDVAARAPQLRAIEVPDAAAVAATYAACVTTSSDEPERATAWVDGLTTSPALDVMRAAGFAPPAVAARTR